MPPRFLLTLLIAGLLVVTSTAWAASDFQATLAASGETGYIVTSVSNSQVNLGSAGRVNPTINLVLGKRYGFTNTSAALHPFQIIARGTGTLGDVVLLAQGGVSGSFEADPAVAWTDNGAGTIEFTLTAPLLAAMRASGRTPGYRCSVHTTTMRGAFAIFGDGVPIANPIVARIPKGTIRIQLTKFATGLTAPLGADFGADGRVFVHDQVGRVWIVQGGVRRAIPFLNVTGRITTPNPNGDERGLLGFALHPDFLINRRVFVHTSEPVTVRADFPVSGATPVHQEVIAEWRASLANPNVVDPASRRELLRVDKPQTIHNGGAIRFSPDGFLFISLGDGGSDDDQGPGHAPTGNGQNLNTVLGKILRISVHGVNSANGRYGIPTGNPFVGRAGLDEIYLSGLRNPYSFSFDRLTGDLWIGDVGQGAIEEIDRIPVVRKGANLGWRLKEGTFFFDPFENGIGRVVTRPVLPLPAGLLDPIAQYDHDDGSAIIGGFVYRGSAIPALAGKYVFGDVRGRLFYLDTGNVIREFLIGNPDRPLGLFVKGFAQDRAGEIYVCCSGNGGPTGTTGVVLKITRG